MSTVPGIVLLPTQGHQFMEIVANLIIEITPNGTIDRLSTYDDYMADSRIKVLQEELYN